MAATIKDIAEETGLGLATISSYINGGHVREKNRVCIEEAIKKLHYEVNETARGLKTNRTKTIGVVIPELNNTFCAEVLTSMEDVLRRHSYATIICDCRTNQKLEKEAIDFLLRKRVDGIINMPVDTSGKNLEAFVDSGKPIILIDRRIRTMHCNSICVNNREAAENAIGEFLKNGHDRIGIIAGPEGLYTADERLKGCLKKLKEAGIRQEDRFIYHGDHTIQSGIDGLKTLVKNCPDMTAVFATNYEMTMGAMIAVNELGIRIPQDLSFIGFDNLSFAKACTPSLTIVVQPTAEIGKKAAQMILKHLEEPKDEKAKGAKEDGSYLRHDITLKTEIEEGKSVRSLYPKKLKEVSQ